MAVIICEDGKQTHQFHLYFSIVDICRQQHIQALRMLQYFHYQDAHVLNGTIVGQLLWWALGRHGWGGFVSVWWQGSICYLLGLCDSTAGLYLCYCVSGLCLTLFGGNKGTVVSPLGSLPGDSPRLLVKGCYCGILCIWLLCPAASIQ